MPGQGPAATPAAAPLPKALELLLKVEADVRQIETIGELQFLVANETTRLARSRQAFVLSSGADALQVRAVTAIGAVDRNVPRIRWVEAIVEALKADGGLRGVRDFALPAFSPPGDPELKSYPYRFMAWLPFALRDGHVFGGMLLTRETPWVEADLLIAKRLAVTYAHAWAALAGERRLKRKPKSWRWYAGIAAGVLVAGLIPVPLTVLAPVQVVPVGPRIIAAPLDGVVDSILVDPDQMVRMGDPLVKMSDVLLRNELAVAEQSLGVAEARLLQVTQGALADPKQRAELAIARSELTVAVAKRDYARDMLERSEVRSPVDGVAIYTDRRDWVGRPLSTGERIMEVADPGRMQLRIDVPVADAIAVREGASVRAFLDSDPLRPAAAAVSATSFEARMIEGDILAYRIYATLDGVPDGMRLGIRGTAQISGDRVPLAYYLLRKPITVLRQRFGL